MHNTISRFALCAGVLSLAAASVSSAQATKPRDPGSVTIIREPGDFQFVFAGSANRAVLGVTLAAASSADTAGVRLDAVDANGPAAKAGLKAGDILTEINGTSLKVNPADAEDLALGGIAQRRLQRVLAKAKPGDEVDLRVKSGTAAARDVKVKTVSAAELSGARPRIATTMSGADDRSGAIGLSIGSTGSVRDTLGLFINSVVRGGPAEKAGIIEGERIAAVNGVDVRVAKEDIDDPAVASARVNRFTREVRKVAPGSPVTLRVYGNGRYREVAVNAVKMTELIGEGRVRVNGFLNGQPLEFGGEELGRVMEQLRGRLQELRLDGGRVIMPRMDAPRTVVPGRVIVRGGTLTKM